MKLVAQQGVRYLGIRAQELTKIQHALTLAKYMKARQSFWILDRVFSLGVFSAVFIDKREAREDWTVQIYIHVFDARCIPLSQSLVERIL